jgi:hypothetical protein
MALSEKARALVELMTGKKVANKRAGNVEQFRMSRPVENVQLKEGTIAFIKNVTNPTSELVKSHLAGRRMATITKRAAMTPISADEMQGATPQVAPWGKPRTEPGLSDADLKVLEQEITTGSPALAPAQATKLFLESYAVISAHGGRRISVGE